MKVWDIFIYYLVLIVISISFTELISAKTISDAQDPSDSNDQVITSQVKDPDFLQFKSDVRNVKDSGTNEEAAGLYLKFPKINLQGTQCYDIPKRAVEEDDKRLIKGYPKFKRRRSPFGIVYKDGKPIGILEPISRIYEYQNFQEDEPVQIKNPLNKRENEIPTKIESDNTVKRDTDNIGKSDIKYSKVLTNYKGNSRSKSKPFLSEDTLLAAKTDTKRDVEKSTLKAPIEKRESNGAAVADPKLSAIENNLKEIISDLNTINEDDDLAIDKRDVQMEDEDLDNGINKIGITKELHTDGSKRKFELKSSESSLKQKKSPDLISAEDNTFEGDNANSRNNKRIADYRNEGESYIRQKRQQANREGQDIVKGLEASGDLTVSGNKSPLASASAPVEAESKNKKENFEKRDKQAAEDMEYEKRLQRNIQDKISEIKEQVKREIKALKTSKNGNGNSDVDSSMAESFDKKRDATAIDDLKKARKKRNLLERTEEDAKFALVRNTESDSLIPHIRNRREADETDAEMENTNDIERRNHASWGIDQGDVGRKETDINKREDLKLITGQTKRDTNNESPLGFQTNQNQDVIAAKLAEDQPEATHVLATRSTRLSADAAELLDAEKLEKLVKESASLTESIKSERGARFNDNMSPHIEVELHSGSEKSGQTTNQKREKADSSDTFKHEDEETVALTQNHADTSNLIVNSGDDEIVLKRKRKREARSKQNTEKKQFQQHRETAPETEEKTKGGDAPVVQDGTSSSSENNHEQKFKVYETSNAKLASDSAKTSDSSSSVSAEAKSIEIRTDSPEGGSKLVEDGSKNSATSDSDKEEKVKSTSNSEKASDNNAVADEDSTLEDRELNKRSAKMAAADAVFKDGKQTEDFDRKIRQERKSEPNLSLEDMQEMDSENNMKRKRRDADEDYFYSPREKRAQYAIPNGLRYRNYRGDEDEADDESDEFDDDNFDDRTANLVRKRATNDLENYDEMDDDYEPLSINQDAFANRVSKRNVNAREFVAKMNDDAYDNSNYLYDANGTPLNRNKRQIFDKVAVADVAALHSGGPMIRHLAAIKGRNNAHLDNSYRRKRLEKGMKAGGSNKNQMISGLSESDIFGGLPQSYEGELTRFKRVKRDDPSTIDTISSENT